MLENIWKLIHKQSVTGHKRSDCEAIFQFYFTIWSLPAPWLKVRDGNGQEFLKIWPLCALSSSLYHPDHRHKTTATHVRFAIGEPEQNDQIKKETQVSLMCHLSGKTSTSHTYLVSGGDPTPPPHASAIFISIITITKAWKYVPVLLSS